MITPEEQIELLKIEFAYLVEIASKRPLTEEENVRWLLVRHTLLGLL